MAWQEISVYLHEVNILSIVVRLSLAALFGALLGMDRARKHRPAGFRTHMLVCLGSTLVMITNQYLFELYGMGDPARLGAQVISGIGFLGAGTIIVTRRNEVQGLTTAAGLWADACIGLAIGVGFYSGAVVGGLFILFIVIVMSGIDERLQNNSKFLNVYCELVAPTHLSLLLSYMVNNGIEVHQVEMVPARSPEEHLGSMIHLKLPERVDHDEVLQQLRKIEGVEFISKL